MKFPKPRQTKTIQEIVYFQNKYEGFKMFVSDEFFYQVTKLLESFPVKYRVSGKKYPF